jgi:glycosyltransferase involved in cell wall biosynthesis
MIITIITVCYNAKDTLIDAIDSVASQSYEAIEHIVVDGGSSDGTLDILQSGRGRVAKWISEQDKGIYDAMNKGIALASGDVIGFLNADDLYADRDAVKKMAEAFKRHPEVDACYADLVYVDQNDTNSIVRYWKSRRYTPGLFRGGWMPAHPTFYARKAAYQRCGTYDTSFRIAADFELMFRMLEIHRIQALYLPVLLVRMRLGGTTNKNVANIVAQNKEILGALRSHYGDVHVLGFVFNKFFNRLKQFISRPSPAQ